MNFEQRPLIWSDEVPKVPGWYWRKEGAGECEMVRLHPYCGGWPEHWRQRRKECLEAADEDQKIRLSALPDAAWIVLWAGPIPDPQDAPGPNETSEGYTYASRQATRCAGCGEHKHTPIRNDIMGGYVCLLCVDRELDRLQALNRLQALEQKKGVGMPDIENIAKQLYTEYCENVGGKAWNGDPLPSWEQFRADPNKRVQSDAWMATALKAVALLQRG